MRKKRVHKKYYKPDTKYQSVPIGRFINYLMQDGKKTIAEKILYNCFDLIQEEEKQEPVKIFEKALTNATPLVEVVSRRIGGANYQVPREVRPERKFQLAARWLIAAARARRGKPMARRLAEELLAASRGEGETIRKKQNVHKMAEANRAFAHFSW